MPWPEKVIRQFQTVLPNPAELHFHGAYNKLLCILFPPDSDFTVVPHYVLQPSSPKPPDYTITFEFLIQFEKKPVFVLQLRNTSDINDVSSRYAADKQIRERLVDLARRCPVPTMHAVSALGTRLGFYRLDTADAAEIVPLKAPRHPHEEKDSAPAEWWEHDVLSTEGEQKLHAVVDEITKACANVVDS